MTTFNLKRHWYEEIACGGKTVEYRSVNPYWSARMSNLNQGDLVRFRRGYFDRSSDIYAIVDYVDVGPCPYNGFNGDFYRIHFHLKGGAK